MPISSGSNLSCFQFDLGLYDHNDGCTIYAYYSPNELETHTTINTSSCKVKFEFRAKYLITE